MLKALFFTALLAFAFVPGTATASVDLCDTYGVCPILRVGDDWACAGIGLGTQGIAPCGEAQPACARWMIGFNREEVCATLTLP